MILKGRSTKAPPAQCLHENSNMVNLRLSNLRLTNPKLHLSVCQSISLVKEQQLLFTALGKQQIAHRQTNKRMDATKCIINIFNPGWVCHFSKPLLADVGGCVCVRSFARDVTVTIHE